MNAEVVEVVPPVREEEPKVVRAEFSRLKPNGELDPEWLRLMADIEHE